MTRGELARLLMGPFGADTADRTARRVCAEDGDGAVGELYRLATQPDEELPRPLRRRVLFRGAWVLERIYFGARDRFMPHAGSFCRRNFAAASDPGRRRLFEKIMADLLVREERLCGGEELAHSRSRDAVGGRSGDAGVGEGLDARFVADVPRPGRMGRRRMGRPDGDARARCRAGARLSLARVYAR